MRKKYAKIVACGKRLAYGEGMKNKTLQYKTIRTKIHVYIGGKLWQVWDRNDTTDAIAAGRISPPADLNMALLAKDEVDNER